MFGLPIDEIISDIRARLCAGNSLVLEAPPGAGKTTVVPLILKDEPWLQGHKIVMLEPRRLAARAAARRMASLLNESVGETVGYTMRLDRKVGPKTRIEVVTEGVLVRRLQRDPTLPDTGLVIFDEFHERSLDADLGLALTLEARAALRDDLKIMVMSATLDGVAVASLLGDAPVLRSAGRAFPVETRFLDKPAGDDYAAETVRLIRRALCDESGSILAFLPGAGEIRRAATQLEAAGLAPDVILAPLYGDLSAAEQDRAISPAPTGSRKVVLATAIAETSLTIEGVRVVVDSGKSRLPRFDPASGMSRLETVKVSAAAAAQRRGRAGRTGPGVCYRAWTMEEDRALIAHHPPEIAAADLAPLALDLALWGTGDAASLAWLTPPPAAALAQARELLQELGALDERGRITAHGKAMAELPVHPRLAHMLINGHGRGHGKEAALIAALLSERDIFRGERARADRDLRSRLEAGPSLARLKDTARRLVPKGVTLDRLDDLHLQAAGELVALAYPDRIAKRRAGLRGVYVMANGRAATIEEADPLAASDYLAIASLDGDKASARIFLAAPLDLAAIEDLYGAAITRTPKVAWDSRQRAVTAQEEERLWGLVLAERPLSAPEAERRAAVISGIRELGIASLPWTRELDAWRARVEFVRRHDPEGGWPDLSDAALIASLETWLAPYLEGINREAQFAKIDLAVALKSRLDWAQGKKLEELAPSHLAVPSGSRLPLDYGDAGPVLAVRLQEMFGATDTPRVMNGRVAVTLHLLSPAHRPVQVTQDLAGFWARSYMEVKRDLKGRYPKHYWPDDPLAALPTARAKRRQPME
ncbi:MAG: ATP-dependent helicase HrpB [Proteobacteria bacterium]|nr:MAG: ATP-dependent helicase HrpB [Pseudomonadota bacterium]